MVNSGSLVAQMGLYILLAMKTAVLAEATKQQTELQTEQQELE